MLDLINAERLAAGRDPLALELVLNTSAETHSDWMLDTDLFSHTGAGGSTGGDRIVAAGFDLDGAWAWGENIAYRSTGGDPGYLDEVAALHDALMDSPGHRANILSENFDYVGIGIEIGEFNGFEAVMITQNFARTDAAVQPDTGAIAGDGDTANTAPDLVAQDVTLSRAPGDGLVNLADLIAATDADGDAITHYELLDTDGRKNFLWADGTRIDARKPVQVAADALDQVLVRHDRPGTQTELQVRAFDGSDYSGWETITLTTAPTEAQTANDAPVVTTRDVTLSKLRGDRYADVADLVELSDPNGDTIVFLELRDTEGRDNFLLRDGTKLDAETPYRLDPEMLDDLMVRFDIEGSVTQVDIRAFDGTDYSDWAQIAITTLANSDLIG